MYEVFIFYLETLKKLFNLLDSFEIFPGISYLSFMVAVIFISVFIKIISFGLKDDFQSILTFGIPSYKNKGNSKYVGKHSSEYLNDNYQPRHGKK